MKGFWDSLGIKRAYVSCWLLVKRCSSKKSAMLIYFASCMSHSVYFSPCRRNMAFLQCSLDALCRSTRAFLQVFFSIFLDVGSGKIVVCAGVFLQCSCDALYRGATGHFCRVL